MNTHHVASLKLPHRRLGFGNRIRCGIFRGDLEAMVPKKPGLHIFVSTRMCKGENIEFSLKMGFLHL